MIMMRAEPADLREPVAIFGWGVSGQGAASLLDHHHIDFEVFDEAGRSNFLPLYSAPGLPGITLG